MRIWLLAKEEKQITNQLKQGKNGKSSLTAIIIEGQFFSDCVTISFPRQRFLCNQNSFSHLNPLNLIHWHERGCVWQEHEAVPRVISFSRSESKGWGSNKIILCWHLNQTFMIHSSCHSFPFSPTEQPRFYNKNTCCLVVRPTWFVSSSMISIFTSFFLELHSSSFEKKERERVILPIP